MLVSINRIHAGLSNVWLIRHRGVILVDAGMAGSAPSTLKRLEAIGVPPKTIGLVVLTHGHGDHSGSAAAICAATGAKLAVHQADRRWVQQGTSPFPPGVTAYGRFFAGLMAVASPVSRSIMQVPPARADLIVGDDGLDLKSYGIAGRIVHTPGHTPGSLTVLLESGEAFVGCMAMNGLPFCLKPSLPIFAMDLPRAKESWRRLLRENIQTIYPAHGKPFPAEMMRGLLT